MYRKIIDHVLKIKLVFKKELNVYIKNVDHVLKYIELAFEKKLNVYRKMFTMN